MSFQQLAGMFPMNVPMTGHTVPGQPTRYPSKTVTYHDNTIEPALRQETVVNPLRGPMKYMGMHGQHTSKHPMMQKLLELLGKKAPGHPLAGPAQQPHMSEGYQRVREDLSWRGRTGGVPKVKAV